MSETKKPNLIRRPSGWAAHLRVGGRQHWRTFRNEAEAQQWLQEMRGLRGGARSAEWTNPAFSAYARKWLSDDAALRVRPATVARYRQLIEHHLIPQFGKRRLAQISADDVSIFVRDWLADGPLFEQRERRAAQGEQTAAALDQREPRVIQLGSSAQTVTHALNVGSAIFRSAIRDRCALTNPFAATPRPSIAFNERPWLSTTNLQQLLRQLHPDWLPFYALLAGTGLRYSEAAALRWRDIDLNTRRLVVSRRLARDGSVDAPKTPRSRRSVPIPAAVVSMLREHYLRSPRKEADALVFANGNGNPLSDSNLRKRVLTPALRAAGLADAGHHIFRHSFITASLAAGTPIGYVSKIVGHSSISVTVDRYGHLVMDTVDEAGERINDFMFIGLNPNAEPVTAVDVIRANDNLRL